MAVCSANDVANYLISFAREHGDYLTPLKLQKLVFYADAWHMVTEGEELIPDRFEAWVHGPVVRQLYSRFSGYKWNPITGDVPETSLSETVQDFLSEIYRVFGHFTGYELEQLTHQERPWIAARGALPPDAPCSNLIDKSLTRDFYTALSEG